MGKQPVAGNKKSKDSIAKAATQSKGPAKVIVLWYRNGTRVKSRKKLITQYFSIELHTIDLLPASPNSENTSTSQESSKNSRSSDPSREDYSNSVLRTDHCAQPKPTASKPSTPPSPSSRPKSQKLNKPKANSQKQPPRRNRNDTL